MWRPRLFTSGGIMRRFSPTDGKGQFQGYTYLTYQLLERFPAKRTEHGEQMGLGHFLNLVRPQDTHLNFSTGSYCI